MTFSPNLTGASGGELYTRPREIDPVRAALGGIDLDPCSCDVPNRTVRATMFYSAADNGLRREWHGRVWVNPPGSRAGFVDATGARHHEPAIWWLKLIAEHEAGRVRAAAFLVFNLETLRHVAKYAKVPHPTEGDHVWLFERPSYNDATGQKVKGSPAHSAMIALLGDVNLEPLRSIGKVVRRGEV